MTWYLTERWELGHPGGPFKVTSAERFGTRPQALRAFSEVVADNPDMYQGAGLRLVVTQGSVLGTRA